MLRDPEASHGGKGQREDVELTIPREGWDCRRELPSRINGLGEFQLLLDSRCSNQYDSRCSSSTEHLLRVSTEYRSSVMGVYSGSSPLSPSDLVPMPFIAKLTQKPASKRAWEIKCVG